MPLNFVQQYRLAATGSVCPEALNMRAELCLRLWHTQQPRKPGVRRNVNGWRVGVHIRDPSSVGRPALALRRPCRAETHRESDLRKSAWSEHTARLWKLLEVSMGKDSRVPGHSIRALATPRRDQPKLSPRSRVRPTQHLAFSISRVVDTVWPKPATAPKVRAGRIPACDHGRSPRSRSRCWHAWD